MSKPARPVGTARLLWLTSISGYLLLGILLLARYLWLAPGLASPWLTLPVLLVPWLFPARGLMRADRYTHKWSGFIALGFLAFGIDGLASSGWSAWLGAGETFASALWFIGAVLFVRVTRSPPDPPAAPAAGP